MFYRPDFVHKYISQKEMFYFMVPHSYNTQNSQFMIRNDLVTVDRLDNMKSRSIDTRTMMSITKEEVEHLILNNYCQPGMKHH